MVQSIPLDQLHRDLGAKMVPFAGYDMPVQYPAGIIKEHLHTREAAGLFDVSHMGQVIISGADATAALEALLPVDLQALPEQSQVYALLTNDAGGVRDDLIITRWGPERFFLVINAACKEQDLSYLRERLPNLAIEVLESQALLALQGPQARAVIASLAPAATGLTFMQGCETRIAGASATITCSGYTGEDGFEISVTAADAAAVAEALLANDQVQAVGLGARDSLRLEAGLCLYGHELDMETTPVEAALMWSISRERRVDGARAGGFPGAEKIFEQAAAGATRKRVGLKVAGKRPVREGQSVLDSSGQAVGRVTSACYAPSLGQPVAMAFVEISHAALDTELAVDVRGKALPVTVSKMPFIPQRYHRG
ncbi:MAG: glycine cleavage system aminomethyltransferase GcvT [Gammaproteobacteria bacterium]|nr:glycine cleavage system aminomethyltransferase GcvT [Gammaproteobacteria bacterium]